MRNAIFVRVLIIALALFALPARAQSPSPESLAAAKELMSAVRMTDQMNAILPLIMQQIKPVVVQGRANIERDWDAMAPAMTKLFQARVDEFVAEGAAIYAKNFSVEDLKAITAFYRTPAGQRALEKMPVVMQQAMAMGNVFGEKLARDLKETMTEELKKKGSAL